MIAFRYQDVLPYEENRVRLTPTRDNRMGYINASHISAAVGSSQRFYIAAQGPSSVTVADFWQLIWECDVYVIVMMTDISPSCDTKAATSLRSQASSSNLNSYSGCVYWPRQEETSLTIGEVVQIIVVQSEEMHFYNDLIHIQYRVRCQFSNPGAKQATTKLCVTHLASGKQRSIWHLQYSDWADHGCPKDTPSFLSMFSASFFLWVINFPILYGFQVSLKKSIQLDDTRWLMSLLVKIATRQFLCMAEQGLVELE